MIQRNIIPPHTAYKDDPIAWAVYRIRRTWPTLTRDWPNLPEENAGILRKKVYAELRMHQNREELIGQFDERVAKAKETPDVEVETEARSKRRTRASRKKAS